MFSSETLAADMESRPSVLPASQPGVFALCGTLLLYFAYIRVLEGRLPKAGFP